MLIKRYNFRGGNSPHYLQLVDLIFVTPILVNITKEATVTMVILLRQVIKMLVKAFVAKV